MKPLVVAIGGTTRPLSTSERLAKAVLAALERKGAQIRLFGGSHLASLPHFAPESDFRTQEQQELVSAVRQASGLVIATPGYHGGVSGLVKNAIDLLEDTRNDRRTYFDGMPVGLVVTAAGWQAGGCTLSALRDIVHAMRGWPTPLGIAVNTVAQPLFGPSGELANDDVSAMVEAQADQIFQFTLANSATQ